MFVLVLDYQRPRIIHYLKMLQDAFAADKGPKRPLHHKEVMLSETWLQKRPRAGVRTWVDDHGNEFKIPIRSSAEVGVESEAAVTNDSFKDINDEVGTIFGYIHVLGGSGIATRANTRFTDSDQSLLKKLMAATFDLWKSVRHQSAIKARLRSQLGASPEGLKRQKAVIKALKFLCRIYLSAVTFIDAAENIPVFRSVEWVAVKVPPLQSQRSSPRDTPMEMIKSLGLGVVGDGWVHHLQRQASKDNFQQLRKQKRFMHAECQVLYHHDAFYTPMSEAFYVHPYIGCSRLCCLFCYCFILVHGGFKIRGTHETVMHRWTLPADFPTTDSHAKFRSTSQHLFNILATILRDSFEKSYPLTHIELLAQSSAALSTAQTVLDREMGQMEKSHANIR
jgi:OTT_1508-like deaminase